MAGGFESLGLSDELIRAIEGDLNWLLPTDVQDESIPLILGGGDVMAAAETGSGKTAAFSLPVLQLVMEAKRREAEGKDGPGGAGAARGPAEGPGDWRVSGVDRDPMLEIEGDGATVAVGVPRWVGGRATLGVQGQGCKAYFEATMLDSGLGRVGWATTAANYNLGTDKYGYGFGGTGMKSQGGKFDPYGESFGQGDVIGCFLDLAKGVVGFSKNGKPLGDAFALDPAVAASALFPAVVLKQARAKLNFTGPFAFPPGDGFQGVGALPAANVLVPTFKPSSVGAGGGGGGSGGGGGKKGGGDVKSPLALIIEPARDLAEQVYNCILDYSRYAEGVGTALVVGGVEQSEIKAGLRGGCDIVVGTTGKLMDLVKRGQLCVDRVRFFILDEADRLLETGNRDDIMALFSRLPKGGVGDRRLQVCFFSATLHSPEITELAERICDKPTWVDLKGKDSVPESVHHVVVELDPRAPEAQALLGLEHAKHVATDNVHPGLPGEAEADGQARASELLKRLKPLALLKLIEAYAMEQCLIFCRTNLDCDLLEQFLVGVGGGQRFRGKAEKGKENPYSCCVLAGMRSMQERRQNLQAFKDGDVRFLICTDVAARGIDIQGLPYVINLTLPDVVENYIHRVGRVGRADCVGLAISLVAAPGVPEQVWYHSCANRGKGCTNRAVKERGGCTIWYDEPDLLKQVEARLHVARIPRLSPPAYALPPEIKAQLGGGKYGEAAGSGVVNETVARHVELLQPAVQDLAQLEYKAQVTWLSLRQRYGGGVQ